MRQKDKIKLFKYVFDVLPTLVYTISLIVYWKDEAASTITYGFNTSVIIGVIIFLNITYYIVSSSIVETIVCLPMRLYGTIYIVNRINVNDNYFGNVTKLFLIYNICITILHISMLLYRGWYKLCILYHRISRITQRQNFRRPIIEDIIIPVKYTKKTNESIDNGNNKEDTNNNKFSEEMNECSICLEEFNEDDHLSQLVCRHRFHEVCCNGWLENHHTCPLCRKPTNKKIEPV